jgi:predicted phosphodiesterase
MASDKGVKSRLARLALKKFPNSAKRAIAEFLYVNHPLTFKDKEDARTIVRYVTDSMGEKLRKQDKDTIEHKTNFSSSNPYGLPPSEEKEFKPYVLPKVNNNILFLSDIHLPYHNIKALTLAIKYGKDQNVNTIYLNGDIIDFHKASFHEQDPSKRDLAYELEQCRQFLQLLRREFPKANIFFKEGNHEMRWERFLRVKAPVVLGIEEFKLNILLRLEEYKVHWIPNSQLVIAGKLHIIHGNEYKGGGGINVARTLWLRAGASVIAGDKHKTQSGLKTNIDKSVTGTWSVGCLCELNPDYLPFNEWNLGFAHITIENNGTFTVNNKQIINGRVH